MSRKRQFFQSLAEEQFSLMEREAKLRGISVQDFIRAVVIPDWLKQQGVLPKPKMVEA